MEPIEGILNFRYCIFSVLKFYLFFSCTFYFSADNFDLSIHSRLFTFTSWNVVVMDVLKSFCNNFNIWVISKLALLSFLLRIGQIFLVFFMSSNLGLYPGHFEDYVMRP